MSAAASTSWGAGGTLTLRAEEESNSEPALTRLELWRDDRRGKPILVRRTVPAGVGVVLDRSADLSLSDGTYHFRAVRGPEYRVITGNFTLERESLDEHTVRLPRMIDMLELGWTSGDCLVPSATTNLPIRMASEDLHLANTLGKLEPTSVPGRKPDDPIKHAPLWIVKGTTHLGGLAFYGSESRNNSSDEKRLPVAVLAGIEPTDDQIRVAVEDPFAWPLPVWLASQRLSGFFLLGDWLRLDRKMLRPSEGRGPQGLTSGDAKALGYWAEEIYWNALEAGFRLPPLAGTGSDASGTPVGYNRLYVAKPEDTHQTRSDPLEVTRVTTADDWWEQAWAGHSVATNGPILRPRVGGEIPGHVFRGRSGQRLELAVELSLTVRDPVKYLEVVHNGRVHYSARLDEFAKAGGRIPPVIAEESGWILVRVVTEYADHFRAAISAPWYVEFDQKPRVSRGAVTFFRNWLAEYEENLKRLPAAELQRHIPYVRAARTFWKQRADRATE